MAAVKKASLVWTGPEQAFHTTMATGYEFDMVAPAGTEGATPMEFLLAAAAGCTGMDLVTILQKRRQKISEIRLEISGTQAEDPPNVFTEATLTYIIRGEGVDPAAVERAIELSLEKYCSASIMLKRAGMELTTDYRIEEVPISEPA